MVGTINPVVYGAARRRMWLLVVALHAGAHVVGGAFTGSTVGAVGLLAWHGFKSWTDPTATVGWDSNFRSVLWPIAILALACSLHEFGLIRLRLPNTGWQVPARWRSFPAPVTAVCYGFCLGLGVVTNVPHTTLYVVLAMCAASGNPWIGAAIMALYGFCRGATTLWIAANEPKVLEPTERTRSLQFFQCVVGCANGAALAVIGGTMLGLTFPLR